MQQKTTTHRHIYRHLATSVLFAPNSLMCISCSVKGCVSLNISSTLFVLNTIVICVNAIRAMESTIAITVKLSPASHFDLQYRPIMRRVNMMRIARVQHVHTTANASDIIARMIQLYSQGIQICRFSSSGGVRENRIVFVDSGARVSCRIYNFGLRRSEIAYSAHLLPPEARRKSNEVIEASARCILPLEVQS